MACLLHVMALSVIKFHDGGWITIIVTSSLVALAFYIKRHYNEVGKKLSYLNSLVESIETDCISAWNTALKWDPNDKTAVIFVNGYNGLGLHSLLGVQRQFTGVFKNFVFAEIGVVDTRNFKGLDEITNLKSKIEEHIDRYVVYMNKNGFHAEGFYQVGTEIVSASVEIAEKIQKNIPMRSFLEVRLFLKTKHSSPDYFITSLFSRCSESFSRKALPFLLCPQKYKKS